MFVNPMMYP